MLEVLVQLMEDGEYEKCLRQAEQQILRGGWTIAQLAQINMVICRCRVGQQDPYGAIPSGMLAAKLAKDVADWDTLGRTLLSLGTAYVAVRQYDKALHSFYSFFEHSVKYSTARRLEGAIWKHIGVAHQRKLESDKALDALNRARLWFAKHEVDYSSFMVTSDMINTYLQMHDMDPLSSLEPVADLLKAQKAIVKRYPTDTHYKATHLLDLASNYLHQGRLGRSMVCAMKVTETRRDDFWLTFHSHMVLHRCTKLVGDNKQALGYALAARVAALHGRHYELEFIASQAMAEVIRQQGEGVVRELDAEYQALGIDLGQYFSPSLLRRDN